MDSSSEGEEETKEKEMKRNFGFSNDSYTAEDVKDASSFGLFWGAIIGVIFTLVVELAYAWVHGWF